VRVVHEERESAETGAEMPGDASSEELVCEDWEVGEVGQFVGRCWKARCRVGGCLSSTRSESDTMIWRTSHVGKEK
jgi:hypothetical protein